MHTRTLTTALLLAGMLAQPVLLHAQTNPTANGDSTAAANDSTANDPMANSSATDSMADGDARTLDREDHGEWGWLGLIGLAGLLGLRRHDRVEVIRRDDVAARRPV